MFPSQAFLCFSILLTLVWSFENVIQLHLFYQSEDFLTELESSAGDLNIRLNYLKNHSGHARSIDLTTSVSILSDFSNFHDIYFLICFSFSYLEHSPNHVMILIFQNLSADPLTLFMESVITTDSIIHDELESIMTETMDMFELTKNDFFIMKESMTPPTSNTLIITQGFYSGPSQDLKKIEAETAVKYSRY